MRFPPAVHALKLILAAHPIAPPEKQALANALYALSRKLVPSDVADGSVFESSRIVCHFLLQRFQTKLAATDASARWEERSLACSCDSRWFEPWLPRFPQG